MALLTAIGALWLACGIQREKPVLAGTAVGASESAALHALESEVATHPNDAARRRALVQSYLDAHAPGLALSAVEAAPGDVRRDRAVEHVYARALLEQGRSADALTVERQVLAACALEAAPSAMCASAARRVAILQELVAFGVEDAQAHPETSAVAYHNAIHEVRLVRQ